MKPQSHRVSPNFRLIFAMLAMVGVVVLSNYMVQFPLNNWLTLGAFTYPFVFLVSDLTNRIHGPRAARAVAWVGVLTAAGLSLVFAVPMQIAIASATAFILSQMLDISLFNLLRRQAWWRAPLLSGICASIIDTLVFFAIAFYGSEMNWLMLATGDMCVKAAMAILMLAPYRMVLGYLRLLTPRAA